MSRTLQNIFDLDLSPRLMIEASAGTGKTYTIVGLYVRLLIEKKIPVDQILVVTFTRMATRELKDRVMLRLRESLTALQNGKANGDDFLQSLISWSRNFPDAENQLRKAIRNFDDTQVLTIHGFCQKVLKEEALLTGVPFELEVSQTDDLLQEAASDFWRSFIHRHSKDKTGRYYLNKVLDIANSPADLVNVLSPLLGKPYAEVESPGDTDVMEYLGEVLHMRSQLKQYWRNEREEILDILSNCGIKYYARHLRSRLNKLESFLNDEALAEDAPDCINYFTSEYLYNADLKKGGGPVAEHPFFERCQQYKDLLSRMPLVTAVFYREAAQSISKRREELAASTALYSYDDLLIKLYEALRLEGPGQALAQRLQERYPYALVDEFQDTDPVQYEIFDRIYSDTSTDSSLMMIGDPKQAIYAFRGADVYAYLRARDSVQETGRYTLQRNYRSSGRLIQGVNALFSNSDSPFLEEDIKFIPSETGTESIASEYQTDGSEPVPLKFFVKPGIESGEKSRDWAFGETARQVAELMARGQRGDVLIEGRKLMGGDIAILVSSHKDATDLKQRLHALGVDSVTYSREKVFASPEAPRLEMLMAAILDSSDQKAVRNSLVSGFFGNNLSDIYNMQSNEEEWQKLVERLSDLHETWQKQGFYPVFRKLMMQHRALLHFTGSHNSERIITNLHQLAERCAYAERNHHLSGPALLHWFRRRMADTGEEEEETLRLESDQNLVKISTIHNSKGLEFPVVFCPTLWHAPEVKSSAKGILEYHNKNRNLVVNLDQSDSENRKSAYNQHLMERVAEDVRKAYVALTRAKYECRIFWTSVEATIYSGTGALLTGKDKVMASVSNKYKLSKHPDLDDNSFIVAIKKLAEDYPQSIVVEENERAEIPDVTPEKAEENDLKILEWQGSDDLHSVKKLSSFSSLMHHDSEGVSEPDYDQWLEEYLMKTVEQNREKEQLNIFSFPRGAAAGTVIHKLFEHENFDFRDSENPQNREFIAEVLTDYGVDEKWVPVMHSMMRNVCNAQIGDLNLGGVGPEDQLREMEFHLSIHEPVLDSVLNIIRNGAGAEVQQSGLKNYLTGFIDLIVRQNGKYYILDYKSNHLGDSVNDYNQEALAGSVEAAGYDVQYHFYTLALVKMLESRIPDFSYQKHFGGSAYLFIRGMRKGASGGVWFHKPEERVIRNLESLLDRSTKNLLQEK